MTKQLLNDTKIGSTLQKVGRRGVTQTVRPEVRRAGRGTHRLVHRPAR